MADRIIAHAQHAIMCESVSATRAAVKSAVLGHNVVKHVDLILATSIAVLHRPHIDICTLHRLLVQSS
jgi:hypothetical protein